MYPNEIMLSAKFDKSLPKGRRIHTLRKLKHFFTVYAESQNKGIHIGARAMKIRGVPGVYKLRTSRGERVLYEVNKENIVILREYSTHDDQISRAKGMAKNESGVAPYASVFDSPESGNDFEQYEIEPTDDVFLDIEQTEIMIATDEWIAQCEDTQDYIWLASAEQAEIISSNKYPQFISGSAGTGKTTVLFQKLCGMAQSRGEILHITISSVLKEDFQRVYEKFKPKQEIARISFMTIDELYELYLPEHRAVATQEQFLSEFGPMCKKYNVNPQDVWCEIEGIIKSHLGITNQATISFLDQLVSSASTTLSCENYCNVKTKYSYFSVENRNAIHAIAKKYDKWLTDRNLSDTNQLAAEIIKSGKGRKYDLIIIDEVQDFTELQLYMLIKLAKSPTRILFCGDINQNVRPTFFMFERLYNIYYSLGCKDAKKNMFTLTKNYRSCKEIVVLLNRILDEQGQRIGLQGAKEDEGIHEIGFREGHTPIFIESTDDNIKRILSAIFDKHYAIAVTPDEPARNALSGCFPDAKGRVFTVQEAKGLEYDVVFTVNVTSAYEKDWHKILNSNDLKRKRRFRRFFGYIYVAASRARNHLIIAEKGGNPFLELVVGTYEIIDEWDLTKVGLATKSTADDFDKDAKRLKKAGLADKAEEARIMAQKMREKEIAIPAAQQIEPAENSEAPDTGKPPPVRLTKRLFLSERDNKQGVIADNGDIIIHHNYDSISFSAYKDENGKSVFECRLNGRITHYDQKGDVFEPGPSKQPANAAKHKRGAKRLRVFAAVFLLATLFFIVFVIVDSYANPLEKSFANPNINPLTSPLHGVSPDNASARFLFNEFASRCHISSFASSEIIQIAAGHTHSAALTADGLIWTWGDNLWDGKTARYTEDDRGEYDIVALNDFFSNIPMAKEVYIDDVISIKAGGGVTAALTGDGSLWTWGYNRYGALGNGVDFATPDIEFEIDSKPYKILDDVQSVSLGFYSGMAIKKDGTLWAWGLNRYGTLGNGTVEHSCEPIKIMDDVAMAAAGVCHGAALKKDGTVWVWGDNSSGQLGNADSTVNYVTEPQKLIDDVVELSVGYTQTSAIKKDGTIWLWGGTTDGRATRPIQLPIDYPSDIVKLEDGNCLPLYLASDGTLFSWEKNQGRLYYITDSVVQVSMFSNHFFMLKEDGSIWACGSNEYGQLGDGTWENATEPILVYQYEGNMPSVPDAPSRRPY